MRSRRLATLLAATILSASAAGGAVGQTAPDESTESGDIQSVLVQPADPDGNGPNGGSWFVYEVEAGDSTRGRAIIHNPADVPQTVRFEILDLFFNENGTPEVVDGEQTDVGAWGELSVTEAVVPAGAQLPVDFRLDVPEDAEPGDHIGVFMASTVNQQDAFAVERRIARRLYVTVPGDVTPLWEIESAELTERASFFPTTAAVTVQLRNTGRVRVEPTVTAGDVALEGSPILLAKATEQYHGEVDLPWWGGPVSVPIEVTTPDGQVRMVSASIFVIPVGPGILLIVGVVAAVGLRRFLKRRVGRTAAMQQDIDRLERMLREQQTATGQAVPAPDVDLGQGSESTTSLAASGDDRRATLLANAKRARRSGDHAQLEGVALLLHEHDGNALELLLESATITGDADEALTQAAATYGAAALSHRLAQKLPAELRHNLERRVAEELLGMHASTASATVGVPTPGVGSDAIDLAAVPGLGNAKQQALLDHFGSLEAIAQASVDELTEVRGIGPGLASKVVDHLADPSA